MTWEKHPTQWICKNNNIRLELRSTSAQLSFVPRFFWLCFFPECSHLSRKRLASSVIYELLEVEEIWIGLCSYFAEVCYETACRDKWVKQLFTLLVFMLSFAKPCGYIIFTELSVDSNAFIQASTLIGQAVRPKENQGTVLHFMWFVVL